MIRYILFDVDDTLLDFKKCSSAAIKSCCERYGVEYSDELFCAFLEFNDELWLEFEKGNLTRDELHAIRWKTLFERRGIDTDAHGFEQMYIALLAASHETVDGALELLKELEGRYELCIASNSTLEQQTGRLRSAGMLGYFSQMFVSQSIGAPKPTAEFFCACMSALGQPPKDSVLLVGDSLSADISGAAAFGIKSCWFNRAHKPLPDGLRPELVISALKELPPLIDTL